jgi:predicted site-specific integrase-resolvase
MKDHDSGALLSAARAAEILNTSPQTLANWRNTGRYPLPYVKVGRLVRYHHSDLQAFIKARTVDSYMGDSQGSGHK